MTRASSKDLSTIAALMYACASVAVMGILPSVVLGTQQGGRTMSLVDSEAAFSQRCQEVNAGAIHTALRDNGVTTFAGLAYACGTPQDRPSQAELDTFSVRILGAAPRLGDVSLLKRLIFESCTFVIAQLRQNVQGDASETPPEVAFGGEGRPS